MRVDELVLPFYFIIRKHIRFQNYSLFSFLSSKIFIYNTRKKMKSDDPDSTDKGPEKLEKKFITSYNIKFVRV